ncbi:MAG: hypothetical protein JWR13_5172 [Mycobacterium sp.]|jgi:hypothetical protein|nr:hypothetical protein [Mycobacterium sp.]MCW2734356.1 hypothetical protein [Mycobacterium sp.]MDT5314448.1 hypothetical protein [Mycobacterium sp.]
MGASEDDITWLRRNSGRGKQQFTFEGVSLCELDGST